MYVPQFSSEEGMIQDNRYIVCLCSLLVNIVITALKMGNPESSLPPLPLPPSCLGEGCYLSADFNGVRL